MARPADRGWVLLEARRRGYPRGEGVWVFDPAGTRYLDAHSGGIHVGHDNPCVAQAVAGISRDANTPAEYLHAKTLQCTQRILGTLDGTLDRVHFCRTRTKANELALRLARQSTGAAGIIVSTGSYHAHSRRLAALATGTGHRMRLPDWARAVTVPDPARYPDRTIESLSEHFVEQVGAAVQGLLGAGFGLAAILLDPMFACEGLPAVAASAIAAAVDIVRRAGGMYIADEVQGGLGRTGHHFWVHERYNTTPDLVTVGEALANGIPMGAVVSARHIAAPMMPRSTRTQGFSDHLAACAAAQATLDVLEVGNLREGAVRVGAYLRHRLLELADESGMLGEVRGEGLYQAVEVTPGPGTQSPVVARSLVRDMARRGVLVGCCGLPRSFIRIRPPMSFTLEHVDVLMSALQQVVSGR